MGSECAFPIFSPPDASHFIIGFHYTLTQYGGWLRPAQLRCQYSTVHCVIELHETFQM